MANPINYTQIPAPSVVYNEPTMNSPDFLCNGFEGQGMEYAECTKLPIRNHQPFEFANLSGQRLEGSISQ